MVRTLPNTIIKKPYKPLYSIFSRNLSLQIEIDKPKTFSNQNIIPRLPIPTLQETAERYKKSLLPILKPEDYARAANEVNVFVKAGGLGEVLQTRLHELDKVEKVQDLQGQTISLHKFFTFILFDSMVGLKIFG